VILLVLGGFARAAGDVPTAAEVTERGRSLAAALDQLLAPEKPQEGRVVWLLLDPSPSLATARFGEEFDAALTRNAQRLAGTKIGLFLAGTEGAPALAPTDDFAALAGAVRTALVRPRDTFRDVYADVRHVAGAFSGAAAPREILLVTLENGDAEDEVEATAGLLARRDIRLSAISREAFLSDTYWLNRGPTAPRGYDMAGGDAAFIQVPWGWLFQQETANEVVPSGFGMYGITRLAAASGGRVFLFYPTSAADVACTRFGSCPFCANDHIGCRETYQSHRLRALSPLAGSRSEVFAAAARDPYLKAVLRAWDRASKDGLVRSRPSVEISGGTLKPERRQLGSAAGISSSLNFSSQQARADRMVKDCDRVIADLESDMERAAAAGGSDRYRTIAELTRVLLHVTRVNLILFSGFCREAGPEILASAKKRDAEPPEVPRYTAEFRITGISYSMMPLCHGVKPFSELHLPGGEEADRAIAALAPVVEGFVSRHAHTPFAEAVRRSGLARFQLVGIGHPGQPPDRTISGSQSGSTATQGRARPPRAGAGSSGTGGPASGGGR
jgi:hypothetical protein